MNQEQENEGQNRRSDPPPYRVTPEEIVEEEWFEAGERLSESADLCEIAIRRWEAELCL